MVPYITSQMAGALIASVLLRFLFPAHSTLDFTTLFGLPPDPGMIACHELVHYVHAQQTAGFWATCFAASPIC